MPRDPLVTLGTMEVFTVTPAGMTVAVMTVTGDCGWAVDDDRGWACSNRRDAGVGDS